MVADLFPYKRASYRRFTAAKIVHLIAQIVPIQKNDPYIFGNGWGGDGRSSSGMGGTRDDHPKWGGLISRNTLKVTCNFKLEKSNILSCIFCDLELKGFFMKLI